MGIRACAPITVSSSRSLLLPVLAAGGALGLSGGANAPDASTAAVTRAGDSGPAAAVRARTGSGAARPPRTTNTFSQARNFMVAPFQSIKRREQRCPGVAEDDVFELFDMIREILFF